MSGGRYWAGSAVRWVPVVDLPQVSDDEWRRRSEQQRRPVRTFLRRLVKAVIG